MNDALDYWLITNDALRIMLQTVRDEPDLDIDMYMLDVQADAEDFTVEP